MLIVVSELVQNVVHHTPDGGELTLRLRAGVVGIEVADTSAEIPRLYGRDSRRARGRGLMIVAAVSQAWGIRSSGAGKVVWADIALTEPVAALSD